MFLIFVVVLCFLPNLSLTKNRCPSSKFCSCSKDLTIVSCVDRRLTNADLSSFQNEIPSSTIVLNLSSNALKSLENLSNFNSLQTLDVSRNELRTLPSDLFSKFPQLSSLYVQENSLETIPKSFNEISNINLDLSSNPLTCRCDSKWLIKWFETIHLFNEIPCGKDFCSSTSVEFLRLSPDQSQIVYENDPFSLNCSSSSNGNIFWTLNDKFYSNVSSLNFPRLSVDHSGLWTCHSSNHSRSISLRVLQVRLHQFCPSIEMETSKGHFYWPRTLTGQTIERPCQFGPAAWLNSFSNAGKAFHTCSINRQWIDLDLSQCAFRTNLSREFDQILAKNSTNLLSILLTFLSPIDFERFQFDDFIFLIDLIDDEQEKLTSKTTNLEEISMLIYRLTDLILQINEKFSQFPSNYQMALRRLRAIVERIFDLANRSWLYVGKHLTAMTLESPLPPTICFIPNRPLLTIICGVVNRQSKRHESRLATIQFDSTSNGSVNRFLIYRQATLFSPEKNPVVYIKPISSANVSVVKLIFYDQSNRASIGSWNANETSWLLNPPMCRIDEQNIDLISTVCRLTRNQSIALTFLNDPTARKSLFFQTTYLELAVYVSSIIGSISLFITILFYITCHNIFLMPRSFFHCLINYWLSLAIVLPLFAFGVRRSDLSFLCQLISVSLHYFCLTTIIWLTLLSYCVWQKLYMIWSGKGHSDDENETNGGGKSSVTIVDYDDDGLPIMKIKAKPIIQFYFLAYGISFIICGINVAISREQYISNKICFLNNFESLLTVMIPIGIFIFLLLSFLVAARINIKRLTKEAIRLRNLPDEPETEGEMISPSEEPILSSKPNETIPMINGEGNLPAIDCHQSHLDSLCSSDMDHQHQPSNQLLAIFFQLVLLILIFLSSLSIYLHPLHSLKLPFEHSIYSHLYGFLVLLLTFFILSFYVLSRSDLTLRCKYYNCCLTRKKKRLLNQSYSEPPPPPQTPQHSPSLPLHNENESKIISGDESLTEQIPAPSPPHSHYSSSVYNCQIPSATDVTFGSKYQANLASKYYARHRHLLKTNGSINENEILPLTTLNSIGQEFVDSQETVDLLLKSPMNQIPMASMIRPSTLPISPRPQASPSQAIIRPLPIVRLSSPTVVANGHSSPTTTTTGRNSYRVMPSPTTEERHPTYVYLNKSSHLIQQESSETKTPVWKKPFNGHPHSHVAYIDEDEEGSVSLKSSADPSISSSTTSPVVSRKDRYSSSSSSSTFSNGATDPNQLVLHESSV